ncbi:MAG TPA: type II toxin-antitoxin system HicB family antitoxin [Thermoanaerobaculia bacterium]|nr:type II toxin-antitoxin system HicB family antitoxin [Thermoanaerobaculia bacterium]
MKLEYPYTLEPQEGGGFVVQFPDLEEAFTEGATPEECAFNAAEVLTGILEQRLEDGVEIPLPSQPAQGPVASPSAAVQTAILVRLTRQAEGKSLADLARALGTSWPAVQRLEKPNANPTLKQLERAANALGKRLVLGFEGG